MIIRADLEVVTVREMLDNQSLDLGGTVVKKRALPGFKCRNNQMTAAEAKASALLLLLFVSGCIVSGCAPQHLDYNVTYYSPESKSFLTCETTKTLCMWDDVSFHLGSECTGGLCRLLTNDIEISTAKQNFDLLTGDICTSDCVSYVADQSGLIRAFSLGDEDWFVLVSMDGAHLAK